VHETKSLHELGTPHASMTCIRSIPHFVLVFVVVSHIVGSFAIPITLPFSLSPWLDLSDKKSMGNVAPISQADSAATTKLQAIYASASTTLYICLQHDPLPTSAGCDPRMCTNSASSINQSCFHQCISGSGGGSSSGPISSQ
jgi:hypothetical protein